jgi:hypothetical protein
MDTDGVVAAEMKAYVAMDVYIDADREKATDVARAGTEVMVWLAAYGGIMPVGYQDRPVKQRDVGGTTL